MVTASPSWSPCQRPARRRQANVQDLGFSLTTSISPNASHKSLMHLRNSACPGYLPPGVAGVPSYAGERTYGKSEKEKAVSSLGLMSRTEAYMLLCTPRASPPPSVVLGDVRPLPAAAAALFHYHHVVALAEELADASPKTEPVLKIVAI